MTPSSKWSDLFSGPFGWFWSAETSWRGPTERCRSVAAGAEAGRPLRRQSRSESFRQKRRRRNKNGRRREKRRTDADRQSTSQRVNCDRWASGANRWRCCRQRHRRRRPDDDDDDELGERRRRQDPRDAEQNRAGHSFVQVPAVDPLRAMLLILPLAPSHFDLN